MAGEVSASNIKVGASIAGLVDGMRQASAAVRSATYDINNKLAESFRRANKEQSLFRGGLKQLGTDIQSVGQKMTVMGTLPSLIAAGKAYKDYADLQRLEKGLVRYGESLEGVREIAKLPNIGVFDGAKTLIGLRAVGMESDKATRTIKAFANAITEAGGNAADLEPALVNIKQFLSTGNINQVDLRQLSSRMPQTNQALRDAFGTTDAAELNAIGVEKVVDGLVKQLEKIPPVAGGAGMAMDQVADSFTFFSATIGEGIDKTFDITGKINSLGGFMDDLTSTFKNLNPEAQKAIFNFAGIATALPLVVTAVGGLVKYLPLIATGFGSISWPVAALIGTGAAIAGIVALLPLLTGNALEVSRTLEQLNEQQALVNGNAEKLAPLLAKYEELSKSTKLSAEEQSALKDITKQIAELVPSAVTGWDRYGNAVDINATKVKAYTVEQQKLLTALQNTRREQILLDNVKSGVRKDELQKALQTGSVTQKVNLGMGQYVDQTYKLQAAEIRKYSQELSELNAKEVANRKELLKLGGQDMYVKEAAKLKDMQKERLKISDEYKSALRSENGTLINSLGERARALDKDIVSQKAKATTMANEWNKAKAEARAAVSPKTNITDNKGEIASVKLTSLSISQLEDKIKSLTQSYKDLNPTSKDYKQRQAEISAEIKQATLLIDSQGKSLSGATGVVKENAKSAKEAAGSFVELKNRLEELDYVQNQLDEIDLAGKWYREQRSVKDATDSYKELAGVVAGLNTELKKNTGFKGGLGDTVADGLDKGKNQLQGKIVVPSIKFESNMDDFDAWAEEFYDIKNRLGGLKRNFVLAIEDFKNGLGEMIGEGIGDALSGKGFEGIGKKFLSLIGGSLTQVGKALISYSVIVKAALKALQSLNPYVALGAGIAAIAAGTIIRNNLEKQSSSSIPRFAKGGFAYGEMQAIVGDNPNARFDPEMIAPYSKVDKSIKRSIEEAGGGAGGEYKQISAVVRGSDMYLMWEREQCKNKAYNGG